MPEKVQNRWCTKRPPDGGIQQLHELENNIASDFYPSIHNYVKESIVDQKYRHFYEENESNRKRKSNDIYIL